MTKKPEMKAVGTAVPSGRVSVRPAAEKGRREAPIKRRAERITLSPDRKATGRRSHLLDEAKMQGLQDALIAGNTVENACVMAGIGESSFYRWMREADEAPEGHPLWEFQQRVKKAMAVAEHRNIMVIQKAAEKNWQAAAWFLERRNPKEYGRKIAVGGDPQSSPVGGEVEHSVSKKTLSQLETMTALENILKRVKEKGILV